MEYFEKTVLSSLLSFCILNLKSETPHDKHTSRTVSSKAIQGTLDPTETTSSSPVIQLNIMKVKDSQSMSKSRIVEVFKLLRL
jgi:hypothetical protein